MEEKRRHLVQNACHLLGRSMSVTRMCDPVVEHIAGDGSQRVFYRLRFEDNTSFIAIAPSENQQQEMDEAFSSWSIGRHLYSRGVSVPELFAFDEKTGLILSEDLGDIRLFEYVIESQRDDAELLQIYKKVVRKLVRMAIAGREGFDISWCWQTGRYDRQLMLEKESGYFLAALCKDFFAIDFDMDKLEQEFTDIAVQAEKAPADFFLHRDFQSRNIMLKDDKISFIDYQGGRMGPLAYDLASLLIDPYTGLSKQLQDELLKAYVAELQSYLEYDPDRFRTEYLYLSLQRNLQILGAFAFLSKQRGKVFFRTYIRPALFSLMSMLAKPELAKYSALKQLTDKCVNKALQYEI